MADPRLNPDGSPILQPNQNGQDLADIASLGGGFSQGEKANRVIEGQFSQGYDNVALQAQQDRRAQEADAMRKLAQSNYILQGGSHYTPGSVAVNGKTYQINDYGLAPNPSSDAEKQAATTLQAEMLKRVGPGGSYTPLDPNHYLHPGTGEKIGSAIGTIAGGAGIIDRLTGGKITDLAKKGLSHIPGLGSLAGAGGGGSYVANEVGGIDKLLSGAGGAGGDAASGAAGAGGMGSFLASKALPIAGIGVGTYGLIKNKSLGSDIGSGASAGAGIGTMIMPGIGTGIGAGIGALAGWGRHAFGGPDGVEKEGRSAGANSFSQLGASATPEQRAQAQSAGWAHPEEALAYIVMGDKLRAAGQDPALADQYMKSLYGAQKHGAGAVQQASSPIDSMMAGRNG